MARIGILGGTFNPPHVAHLVCAQEARAQLGLDVVRLIPVHTPPHKEADHDPGGEVRLQLCREAVADAEGLEVSRIELDRGGPSYTVDTLRAIHAEQPDDELTFIVGGDQAQGLPTWREPAEVLRLARLAVAEREGIRRADVRARLQPLCAADRIAFFDMPRLDVSSSDVRRRVRDGRPVRWLVPDGVREHVEAHGLYLEDAADPATLDPPGGRAA